MKQKVVIKVSMFCDKCRTKAMQIAVSAPGVTLVEIQGDEKNQIVVTGEGIDSTCLVVSIRKKVGPTELVSVTPIPAEKKPEEKKPEEKKETQSTTHPIVWTHHQYEYGYGTPQPQPQFCWYEVRDPCTIM